MVPHVLYLTICRARDPGSDLGDMVSSIREPPMNRPVAMYIVRDRDSYFHPDLFMTAYYWCKWHMEDYGCENLEVDWERDIRFRGWVLRMY